MTLFGFHAQTCSEYKWLNSVAMTDNEDFDLPLQERKRKALINSEMLTAIYDMLKKHSEYHMDNTKNIAEIRGKVFNGMSHNIERTADDIDRLNTKLDNHIEAFTAHASEEHQLIIDTVAKGFEEHEKRCHADDAAVKWLAGIYENRKTLMKVLAGVAVVLGLLVYTSPAFPLITKVLKAVAS